MALKTQSIQISATNTVIAAVTGTRIRVYAFSLSVNANTNVKFQSHVTPTDLTGLRYLTTSAPNWDMPAMTVRPAGRADAYFETLTGEGLDINMSTNVALGGWVSYEQLPV